MLRKKSLIGGGNGTPASSPFGENKGGKDKAKKGIKQVAKIDALLAKTAKAEQEQKRREKRNACCICGCD